MRKAARTDANQTELVSLMRNMGASVLILSNVGSGCPDLLVGMSGTNALVELKDGSKAPSQRKLTPLEEKFFDEWNGQVCIVATVADAVSLVNRLRG